MESFNMYCSESGFFQLANALRLTHAVLCISVSSLLLLSSIPFNEYTTVVFSSPVGGHLACFDSLLAIRNKAAIVTYNL